MVEKERVAKPRSLDGHGHAKESQSHQRLTEVGRIPSPPPPHTPSKYAQLDPSCLASGF